MGANFAKVLAGRWWTRRIPFSFGPPDWVGVDVVVLCEVLVDLDLPFIRVVTELLDALVPLLFKRVVWHDNEFVD